MDGEDIWQNCQEDGKTGGCDANDRPMRSGWQYTVEGSATTWAEGGATYSVKARNIGAPVTLGRFAPQKKMKIEWRKWMHWTSWQLTREPLRTSCLKQGAVGVVKARSPQEERSHGRMPRVTSGEEGQRTVWHDSMVTHRQPLWTERPYSNSTKSFLRYATIEKLRGTQQAVFSYGRRDVFLLICKANRASSQLLVRAPFM
jgi:hypothetical protein